MKIEVKVSFKTDSQIRDTINGSVYSTWSEEQKKEEIKNCIQTNNILIKNIDINKYKKAILEEVIALSGMGEKSKEVSEYEYSLSELLLNYRQYLPPIMVSNLLSEWSIEAMESFYPEFYLQVVE